MQRGPRYAPLSIPFGGAERRAPLRVRRLALPGRLLLRADRHPGVADPARRLDRVPPARGSLALGHPGRSAIRLRRLVLRQLLLRGAAAAPLSAPPRRGGARRAPPAGSAGRGPLARRSPGLFRPRGGADR